MLMRSSIVTVAAFALCARSAASDRLKNPSADAAAPTISAAYSARPPGIAWFEGTIDEAFSRAKAEKKPVFLYWSAEWCPPCHELKATLFTRREYQEKLKLVVPVYLDGDTPGAQRMGESFGVVAYPTILLLGHDRSELARITGGMRMQQYDEVIDLALSDVKPIAEVLTSLGKTDAQLSRDDCRRLAYNGWAADEKMRDDFAGTSAKALLLAVERCPAGARIERARITIAAAMASSNADSDALKAGKPASETTMRLVKDVYRLVGDSSLAGGIADTLLLLGDEFLSAAQAAKSETPDFALRLGTVASAMPDPMYALLVELRAAVTFSADHKVSPEIEKRVRERIAALLDREHSDDVHASLASSAIGAYYMLGDVNAAFSLAEKEMRTSKQAYYYMSMLADIEEQRGNKDRAVEWLSRAYRESKGPATRFEWGTNYVAGLVRMHPEDSKSIREATLAVLGELDGPDRIHARATTRLKRMDRSLRGWNKDRTHDKEIAVLRERMSAICARIPSASTSRKTCEGFLSEA